MGQEATEPFPGKCHRMDKALKGKENSMGSGGRFQWLELEGTNQKAGVYPWVSLGSELGLGVTVDEYVEAEAKTDPPSPPPSLLFSIKPFTTTANAC